jgi:hypothetical protein
MAYNVRKNFEKYFELSLLAESNTKAITTIFDSQPDSVLLVSKVEDEAI